MVVQGREEAHSPEEHLANEPVLVHWLLVLPLWELRPHLDQDQRAITQALKNRRASFTFSKTYNITHRMNEPENISTRT